MDPPSAHYTVFFRLGSLPAKARFVQEARAASAINPLRQLSAGVRYLPGTKAALEPSARAPS